MVGSGSNEEEGRKGIDATVGGLVWVRRRNGCWWPGQIIGSDELSESCLVSPRSGTPIKLLGRDDSSVDWYDLEKCKGVKAFRCGEYNTCIEKAKASAANSSKRSVKYPRRENAIIHALEIEKTSVFKDCPNPRDNSNSEALLNCGKGSASMSHPTEANHSSKETSSMETTSACEENSHSTRDLSQSGISCEQTNGLTSPKGQLFKGRRRKTPNDSEDDGSEGFKRMKGLNDLSIGSERKVQVLALANPIHPSSSSRDNMRTANCTSLRTLANGGSMPTLKRKRSQVVHIHELLKRKYRRRPLTKVLENTTMVPVRIICDEFANPFERSDAISPSYECEDGNKVKDAELLNGQLPEVDSSDMLYDVPYVDEELHLSCFSPVRQPSSPLKPCISAFRGNSSRRVQIQASSFEAEALNVNQKMEKSASKWQSKGKRNARYLSKNEEPCTRKKADVAPDTSGVFVVGLENPGRFSPSSSGSVNGFTDRRKQFSIACPQRSFPYQQPRFLVHSTLEMPDLPSLYEVEVTVEATRTLAQQVPYISLMSKLSGKPITGHPLPVEALEDGYCDHLTIDYLASGSCELDEEDTEMILTTDPKTHRNKKKSKLRPHFSRSKGKSSKSRKKHGPSAKKTRKLSSLTGPHKLNPEKKKAMVSSSKGPTLACVPLKIVFSRINEALSGSTRSIHRPVTSNNTR